MREKIFATFNDIDLESTKQGYIHKLTVIFNASYKSGKFAQVCKNLDSLFDVLLDLFDDSCPASDH